MSGKQVWFITGAGRGIGVHIARTALAAGNAVATVEQEAKDLLAQVDAYRGPSISLALEVA
jgi:NAD(P)-dependent dehydrogenase (short-subunit alcohol dehydrogenase family)